RLHRPAHRAPCTVRRPRLQGPRRIPGSDGGGAVHDFCRHSESSAMNPIVEGLLELADPMVFLYLGLGLLLGMLVGAFPGITATMAVALASSFTLTLPPIQGLAVLLTIYVASGFGDRVPAILINTPGTPASI